MSVITKNTWRKNTLKILFDTNVLLDLFLNRKPYVNESEKLIAGVERGKIEGYACANSITTIYYLCKKTLGKQKSDKILEQILALFEITPIDRHVLQTALILKFTDYEDAVIHQSAVHSNVETIVTRNIKDFKHAQINIYTPKEIVALLTI